MKKLGYKGRAWLKGIHILFVCAWVGAGIAMMAVGQLADSPETEAAMRIIDQLVVIPSAVGSALTGFILAGLTNWGFTKFNWVIVKWTVTLGQMLFGAFVLGPAINSGIAVAQYLPTLQQLLLFGLVVVAVHKPWGKRLQKRGVS